MRKVVIGDTTEKDINAAARILLSELKPGDVILTGSIPRTVKAKYLDIVSILLRSIFKDITHSCMYIGNDRVIDIDLRLTKHEDVELISVRQLLKNKIDLFGGVRVYVVAPRNFRKAQRRLAVIESKNLAKKRAMLRFANIGAIMVTWRYLYRRRKLYHEDLSFRKVWTCGEMVAYILKRSGIHIGKKASYTFVPPMFTNKKYFHIKQKIILGQ